MTKKETLEVFGKDAEVAAKRLCGCDQCFGNYDCGHPNNVSKNIRMSKLSEDTVCPLAHYNAEVDTRSFAERLMAGEKPLEDSDIFAICACCEYSNGAKEIGEELVELDLTEESYMKHCLDCPVHMAFECMQENRAEAEMS